MGRRRRFLRSAGTASAVALLILLPVLSSRRRRRLAPAQPRRLVRPGPPRPPEGRPDLRRRQRRRARARASSTSCEQRGVTATFFLTGDYIRHNPDLVRRIAAAGHEVGNHTWSHPHLTTWDRTRRHDTLPGVDRAFIERRAEPDGPGLRGGHRPADDRPLARPVRRGQRRAARAGPRRRAGATSAGRATTSAGGTPSTAWTGSPSAPRATT